MTRTAALRCLLPPALALLLAGCAAPLRMEEPVNPEWEQRRQVLSDIEHWAFTGSVSVRDDEESHSSRIRWQQDGPRYRINLWGTFNIGATEINGRPGFVRIEQRGEEPVVTDSPDEMIRQQIGYDLPVEQLDHWIKGIPIPGTPAEPEFGENNQLVRLRQSGWQIEYMAYSNYGPETLPTRIRLYREPLQLDLLRLDWSLDDLEDLGP